MVEKSKGGGLSTFRRPNSLQSSVTKRGRCASTAWGDGAGLKWHTRTSAANSLSARQQNHPTGEGTVFPSNGLRQRVGEEGGPPHHTEKVNSKRIKDPNIRAKDPQVRATPIQHSEEHKEVNLYNLELGKDCQRKHQKHELQEKK